MAQIMKRGHPFYKLRYNVTLEVLKNISYYDALRFIFRVNKEARTFLLQKMTMIRNGFENDGLVIHKINLTEYEEI